MAAPAKEKAGVDLGLDPDRKAIHDQVLDALKSKLNNRPYDDIIFNWCDGYCPRNFSDAEIKFATRLKGKVGVMLGDLYNTDVIEKIDEKVAGSEEYLLLLDFLKDSDKDAEAISQLLSSNPSEADVAAVLAVHLLAKIAPKSKVLLDKNMNGLKLLSESCPCKCDGTFKMGAVGIGSHEAWHGYPDMQVKNVMVNVSLEETDMESSDDEDLEQDAPSSPKKRREETTGDIALECEDSKGIAVNCQDNSKGITVECKKDPEAVTRQMLSQTITNGFAQSTVHDRLFKKFVPSILITPRGVQVYVYNVQHDFLLSTPHPLSIFDTDEEGKALNKLNIPAVLEIWLALHVHILGYVADYFAPSGSHTGLSKCGFQKLMNERNAIGFYYNAGIKVGYFLEKAAMRFKDLLKIPYPTTYVKRIPLERR